MYSLSHTHTIPRHTVPGCKMFHPNHSKSTHMRNLSAYTTKMGGVGVGGYVSCGQYYPLLCTHTQSGGVLVSKLRLHTTSPSPHMHGLSS